MPHGSLLTSSPSPRPGSPKVFEISPLRRRSRRQEELFQLQAVSFSPTFWNKGGPRALLDPLLHKPPGLGSEAPRAGVSETFPLQGMVLSIVALSQHAPWLPSKLGEGGKTEQQTAPSCWRGLFPRRGAAGCPKPAELPCGISHAQDHGGPVASPLRNSPPRTKVPVWCWVFNAKRAIYLQGLKPLRAY